MPKRKPTPKRKPWQPLQRGTIRDPQLYLDHGLTVPDAIYVNDVYSVFVRVMDGGMLHVSFHRHDRKAVRDWRHFQAIKNEVAGAERTAIEVFPPESALVDTSNEYHLWVLPKDVDLGFGFGEQLLMDAADVREHLGPSKARQRNWQPGISTGKGRAPDG